MMIAVLVALVAILFGYFIVTELASGQSKMPVIGAIAAVGVLVLFSVLSFYFFRRSVDAKREMDALNKA